MMLVFLTCLPKYRLNKIFSTFKMIKFISLWREGMRGEMQEGEKGGKERRMEEDGNRHRDSTLIYSIPKCLNS